MSAANPAPCAAEALIAQQMAALTRLTEIGMEIAETAGRAARLAEAGEPNAQIPDPALTYSRAARAVRLTIALQSRLAKDLAALGEAEARARSTAASRRRDRIHRHVERAAEAERADADEIERLASDAWERLTEIDDAELLDLPMDEIVARICADLGLSPDWAAAAFPPLDLPPAEETASPPPAPVPTGSGPSPQARGRPPDRRWISRPPIPA